MMPNTDEMESDTPHSGILQPEPDERRDRTVRRSKAEIYLHLVWATKNREPLLGPDRERAVLRCIEGEARRLGCDVLAVNAMPDHVHLLVKVPTRLSAATLMHDIKGGSSHFVRAQLPDGGNFGWQEGYGVFSVGRNQTAKVIAYIRNQKLHHADTTHHAAWEETDEEVLPFARQDDGRPHPLDG